MFTFDLASPFQLISNKWIVSFNNFWLMQIKSHMIYLL